MVSSKLFLKDFLRRPHARISKQNPQKTSEELGKLPKLGKSKENLRKTTEFVPVNYAFGMFFFLGEDAVRGHFPLRRQLPCAKKHPQSNKITYKKTAIAEANSVARCRTFSENHLPHH